ncbi:hypothetical protein CGRA01v4_06579 [Colletotrichum graminicola]|nr:hypothetical protein CGRA01v4_06579 [Colletotrichum graminicola]
MTISYSQSACWLGLGPVRSIALGPRCKQTFLSIILSPNHLARLPPQPGRLPFITLVVAPCGGLFSPRTISWKASSPGRARIVSISNASYRVSLAWCIAVETTTTREWKCGVAEAKKASWSGGRGGSGRCGPKVHLEAVCGRGLGAGYDARVEDEDVEASSALGEELPSPHAYRIQAVERYFDQVQRALAALAPRIGDILDGPFPLFHAPDSQVYGCDGCVEGSSRLQADTPIRAGDKDGLANEPARQPFILDHLERRGTAIARTLRIPMGRGVPRHLITLAS